MKRSLFASVLLLPALCWAQQPATPITLPADQLAAEARQHRTAALLSAGAGLALGSVFWLQGEENLQAMAPGVATFGAAAGWVLFIDAAGRDAKANKLRKAQQLVGQR